MGSHKSDCMCWKTPTTPGRSHGQNIRECSLCDVRTNYATDGADSIVRKQETHHTVGLGETPRRLIRKLCRYYSVEKFEGAFYVAVHLS